MSLHLVMWGSNPLWHQSGGVTCSACTWMGDHTEAIVPIFILSQIFFCHGHEKDEFLRSYTVLDAWLQLMWIMGGCWYCAWVISHCMHLVYYFVLVLMTCTKSKFAVCKQFARMADTSGSRHLFVAAVLIECWKFEFCNSLQAVRMNGGGKVSNFCSLVVIG